MSVIKEVAKMHALKSNNKIVTDFIYSFFAYALPTVVLQFVVQPLVAGRLDATDNGLFITLYNVVKFSISIFIVPLANLRLLKKNDCNKNDSLNQFFNELFIIASFLVVLLGSIMNVFYRKMTFTAGDILRLTIMLLLICIHDYYMVEFRLIVNYKKIVVDNIFIVIGNFIGVFLFMHIGYWELIFILGYLFGTIYVLCNTSIWKKVSNKDKSSNIVKSYVDLSTSSLLSTASVYCDRMIIFPFLGGFEVSVYNAAAIVSKAILVISSPLRNVLLSYIVGHDNLEISKRKLKKIIPLSLLITILTFLAFWGVSSVACNILYPKYASYAKLYIPVIVFAVIVETVGEVLNIILLRFEKTKTQTILATIKLVAYLVCILLLPIVLKLGLMGFCFATVISSSAYTLAIIIVLKKIIKVV